MSKLSWYEGYLVAARGNCVKTDGAHVFEFTADGVFVNAWNSGQRCGNWNRLPRMTETDFAAVGMDRWRAKAALNHYNFVQANPDNHAPMSLSDIDGDLWQGVVENQIADLSAGRRVIDEGAYVAAVGLVRDLICMSRRKSAGYESPELCAALNDILQILDTAVKL